MVDKLHDNYLEYEADHQWARIDDAVERARSAGHSSVLARRMVRVAQDFAEVSQQLAKAHAQEATELREKLEASQDAGTLHRWRVHAASMSQERAAASRALQDEQEQRRHRQRQSSGVCRMSKTSGEISRSVARSGGPVRQLPLV